MKPTAHPAKLPDNKSESTDKLPNIELVSFGFSKLPNSKFWVSYKLTTLNGVVTNIVYGEPEDKNIANESAKIAYAFHYYGQDL